MIRVIRVIRMLRVIRVIRTCRLQGFEGLAALSPDQNHQAPVLHTWVCYVRACARAS